MGSPCASHPAAAAAAWLAGVAFWTWLEYFVHRLILHGVFPDGPGSRHWLHVLFDHLHVEHHKRPWDGSHINGTLKDTGPFLLPAFLLALLPAAAHAPGVPLRPRRRPTWRRSGYTTRCTSTTSATPTSATSRGTTSTTTAGGAKRLGFGLTSGLWDVAYGTRFPAEVRAALYAADRERVSRTRGGSPGYPGRDADPA